METTASAPVKANAAFNTERVTHIHHWTDQLFSFRTTRSPALRFQSGQFVMIGLHLGLGSGSHVAADAKGP